MVLFHQPLPTNEKKPYNMFYPMYNEKGQIIGTQWLGSGKLNSGNQPPGCENETYYRLPDLDDDEFMFKTLLAKSLYRTYINKLIQCVNNLNICIGTDLIIKELEKELALR